jgi:hypothetical protein
MHLQDAHAGCSLKVLKHSKPMLVLLASPSLLVLVVLRAACGAW